MIWKLAANYKKTGKYPPGEELREYHHLQTRWASQSCKILSDCECLLNNSFII